MNRIIVLIPHYNNIEELHKSIRSINEDIRVDLMIVDDGSIEKPDLNTLKSIYHLGEIFLEILPNNLGIEKALNYGLQQIINLDYQYVGRLDSGDYCKKDRFKKQLAYLDSNPEISLLGTWANVKDEQGNLLYILKHPIQFNDIKKKMFSNSAFVHPTVVFRSSVFNKVGFYPENYRYAEDFALFFNIIEVSKAENYPEVLLDYIEAENSISTTKRKIQVKNRIRIILTHFYFGFYPINGLLRNCILYFISRKRVSFLKRIKPLY